MTDHKNDEARDERASAHSGLQGSAKPTHAQPVTPDPRPFAVYIVVGDRRKLYGRYSERDAHTVAARLRGHGIDAVVAPAEPPEQPEHRGDRRRFLVWAVLCGFAQPERLTERIVAEIEGDHA